MGPTFLIAPLRRLGAGLAAALLVAGLLVALLATDTGIADAADCSESGNAKVGSNSSGYQVGQRCTSTPGKAGATGKTGPVNLDPNRQVCFYTAWHGVPYKLDPIPAGQTEADGKHMDKFCGPASQVASMKNSSYPLDGCTGRCSGEFGLWVPNGTGPTPEEVATSLLATLNLTAPKIHTSPDADKHLVVGLPTWLWIDGDNSTQTASDGPISISAKQTVEWRADRNRVPCTGSGTPYVKGQSDPNKPSPDCGWTFGSAGAHEITATVTWTVTVIGANVALPPSVFPVILPVQVDEVQTVNR